MGKIMHGDQEYSMKSITKLSTLADTNITSVANGQTLSYDSATSKWVNATPSSSSSLASLSDVSISVNATQINQDASAQVIAKSGNNWVNGTLYPLHKVLFGALQIGDTTVSFTDSAISDSTDISYKVYADGVANMSYKSIVISSNTMTITFPEATAATLIMLEITQQATALLPTAIVIPYSSSTVDISLTITKPNGGTTTSVTIPATQSDGTYIFFVDDGLGVYNISITGDAATVKFVDVTQEHQIYYAS